MKYNSSIAAIVEGDGDKSSVPGLLRRILHERLCRYDVSIIRPKVSKGKPTLLKKLEQFLKYSLIDKCNSILVLVDADEECPYIRSTCLAEKISQLDLPVPVAIVYANSEFETWFICNLHHGEGDRIRRRLEIPDRIVAPANAEAIRGAKEWLTSRMPRSRSYQETRDQEVLVHYIDLALTHERSRSFRRLCHAVEELVVAMDSCLPTVTPASG